MFPPQQVGHLSFNRSADVPCMMLSVVLSGLFTIQLLALITDGILVVRNRATTRTPVRIGVAPHATPHASVIGCMCEMLGLCEIVGSPFVTPLDSHLGPPRMFVGFFVVPVVPFNMTSVEVTV